MNITCILVGPDANYRFFHMFSRNKYRNVKQFLEYAYEGPWKIEEIKFDQPTGIWFAMINPYPLPTNRRHKMVWWY